VTSAGWWSCILKARHRVFSCYRKALASDSTPELWLLFQLDCGEWVPFLQIFWALSFFPDGNLSRIDPITSQHDQHYDLSLVEGLWICIDEIQEDVRVVVLPHDNLFSAALAAFTPWHQTKFSSLYQNNFSSQKIIFTGTSLQISEAQQTWHSLYTLSNFSTKSPGIYLPNFHSS